MAKTVTRFVECDRCLREVNFDEPLDVDLGAWVHVIVDQGVSFGEYPIEVDLEASQILCDDCAGRLQEFMYGAPIEPVVKKV